MSSENQYNAQQDSAPGDPDPAVPGWWLFLVTGGQVAGVLMFIKLLARSFDLPGDTLLYVPAIPTLALVTGMADPRTLRHLALISAVSATAALLTFVTTLAAFLIFSPSYFTVVVVVVSSLLGGLAVAVASVVYRRFGIPLRTRTFGQPDEPPPNDNG